jgi:hypothetical protein
LTDGESLCGAIERDSPAQVELIVGIETIGTGYRSPQTLCRVDLGYVVCFNTG